MESGKCAWHAKVHAELSKEYQHIFDEDLSPDFLIHAPDSNLYNLAVIEVKLAARSATEISEDVRKLLLIRGSGLKYEFLVELIVGPRVPLERKRRWFLEQHTPAGERVDVFLYNTSDGTVEHLSVGLAAQMAPLRAGGLLASNTAPKSD
jgi:hypothetical protein